MLNGQGGLLREDIENIDVWRGNYSGRSVGVNEVQGSDFIPVDTSKQYTLVGKFKSVGNAVQDIAVAAKVLSVAEVEELGEIFDL